MYLAGVEGPGAGGAEGDAHGVAGEDFDFGACAAVADVAVDEGAEADEAFDDPDGDDGFEIVHLLEALKMDPQSGQDERDESDVDVPESLVECVT